MRATAAPEEGNKVRLTVEIDETEMDEALDDVMKRLSREVRVPGFRPGKVPRKVLETRMGGATALRGEAIREALPDFYSRAVDETEVDPIDQPDIDITAGEESGPVSFEAVVLVRPGRGHPRLRRPGGDAPGARGDRRGGDRPGRPAAGDVGRARRGEPPDPDG